MNFQGIICFRSVVSFAVMGLVFHYILEPGAEKIYKKINQSTIRKVCTAILILFIIDCILSALFRTPITY